MVKVKNIVLIAIAVMFSSFLIISSYDDRSEEKVDLQADLAIPGHYLSDNTIVVVSPQNFSNLSYANLALFNVTYVNGTDRVVTAHNVTAWTNFTGTWVVINFSTNGTSCLQDIYTTHSACNGTFNVTNVPSGYHTINVTLGNLTGNAHVIAAAVVTSPVRIDNRVPQEVNLTNTVNGAARTFNAGSNISGTVSINVSARDNIGNWSAPALNSTAITVIINVTNSTGGQNGTFTGTQHTNTSNFIVSIDTTSLKDGNNTFTAKVTDESGLFNNTRKLTNIITDNTAPSITATTNAGSTTKTKLVIDLAISDATSGINSTCGTDSSGATVTGTSGSQTITEESLACGTSYTYLISCYDEVRNRKQLSSSHSTKACTTGGGSSGGGGGSGGGAATTWKNTFVQDDDDLSENPTGITQSMGGGERVRVKLGVATHHVGVESVTSNTAVIVVESTPVRETFEVGQTKKFDTDVDDRYELSVTLNSIDAGKASISVMSIDEAITVEEEEKKVGAPEQPSEPSEPSTPSGTTSGKGAGSSWIWIVLVIIVVLVVVAVVFAKKRATKKK